MSEWISVEDRLPEFKEQKVLHVLLKDHVRHFWLPARYDQLLEKALWIPQRGTFAYDGVDDALHLITHWMPLPEPPK